MKKQEAQTLFRELETKRQVETLTIWENQRLHDAAATLIGMYRKCVDLSNITDEELEELESY